MTHSGSTPPREPGDAVAMAAAAAPRVARRPALALAGVALGATGSAQGPRTTARAGLRATGHGAAEAVATASPGSRGGVEPECVTVAFRRRAVESAHREQVSLDYAGLRLPQSHP